MISRRPTYQEYRSYGHGWLTAFVLGYPIFSWIGPVIFGMLLGWFTGNIIDWCKQ